ncbi:flagellar biosynthesis protein FlgA [Gordonia iterans]|uniref:Flagellar biosynthesis protein FlgA n=1 Tax=Gordonia iterans TaxID=1004901 RepID=A0A2S0KDN7_9ACTN|nr:SAF domain-containing protein [Gordonia iterans]AVL99765.1 flagellar biosynthesis protein FlgA [Gordonia iterans]
MITLTDLPRPRAVVVRRGLAVLLLIAAAALAVTGHARERTESVLVAAHQLRPGVVVHDDDVRVRQVPAGAALPGVLREPGQAVGGRLAGAVAPGEALTAGRLLSSRLPAALTGDPRARLVPVRTADPAVAGLLRAGDVVDVLDEEARVLATRAVVAVPAAPEPKSGPAGSSPVLLAMAEGPARTVAGAGLATALTLILH